MNDLAIARTPHVLGVVLWIGGMGFVTTVLLPAVRRLKAPDQRVAFFERVERRFAWQARATTLLVGIPGIYIIWGWNLWARFLSIQYWWMHTMVLVWVVFTAMLFVAEPLFLAKRRKEPGERVPVHRAAPLGLVDDQSDHRVGICGG